MRVVRLLVLIAAATAALAAPPAYSQTVRVTTPYPAVAVEAGQSVTFDLRVTGPRGRRVNLAVTERPRGWATTLRGGGFVIRGVTAHPNSPPDVQLEVRVPAGVEAGDHRVVVAARSGAGDDRLALTLRVAETVEGGVTLSAEFPELAGPSETTYSFDVELANNTPQETTFSLSAEGPEGWQVAARPTTQEQAATVTVDGGSTTTVTVDADPPDDVVAGSYDLRVTATGGGSTAELELAVEITGNFAMTFTTPDERLNVDVVSGRPTVLPIVIINDGTAPLRGVELTATPPTGWQVEFDPPTVDEVPPGGTAQANAAISPSGEAVAGDYVVTLRAQAPEVSEEMELRTSVKTSAAWGLIGILLIVGAIGGLGWVYRRYGRR